MGGRMGLPLTLTALCLSSCTVGPDYARPPVDVPTGFKSSSPEETKEPGLKLDWWTLFGDPTLTKLEEQAFQANQDLKAAMARVAEARASARIATSGYYPQLSFNPLVDRSKTSPNAPRAQGASVTSTDMVAPFDLSYELDLWGKIRRTVESADAQAQASAADLAVVLQTIQADLAQDYFTLRSLDDQIQITGRNVESFQRELSLLQTQFKAGLVGRINVVQEEAQLYSTQTQLLDLQRQRTDLEHAIATLTGRPPSELSLPPFPLSAAPPTIPAGLPASLLRRRPDVAEAEQNLAAASAQIGIAQSQFYPDVRLTGVGGFEAMDLRHLASWQSRIWSLGASAVVPIFQGGALQAALEQSKAHYDEMLAAYRSRILQAFQDVEDSLTDLHLRADEAKAQTQAVNSSREYLRLAETQYQQGLLSYLQVIDAERTLLTNELASSQILGLRFVSTVLLIKALGAGWDIESLAKEANAP